MHLFRLNDTTTASFCLSNENVFAGDLRLLLVGILGTLVSIVSIGQNLLLFYVFATSRKLRRQNYVNPVLLAFFDIFVSTIYLLISPTHFLAHRLDSATLVSFWAKNMRILYCLEHFALTVCNLLLVIASIERFLANGSLNAQRCVLVFIVRRKPYVIAAIIAFALLLKASLYFEIGLFEVPECANLTASLIPVWLADNGTFAQAFRFWTRNFLTVILPFVILAYCNLRIVQQLRKRRRMTLIGEYSGSLMSQTNQQQQQNGTERQFVLVAGKKQSQRLLRRLDSSPTQKQWDPTVKLKTNKEGAADFIVKQMPTMEMNGTGGGKRSGGGEGEDVDHGRRITFIRSSDLTFSKSAKRSAIGQPPCSSANPSPVRNRPKASSASAPPAAGLGASSAASISSPSSTIGVRVATRTLVMVVGCYLISNSMSTVLNIWEYFDVKFLRHDNFHAYLIASDVAALLTICGCALRFPIYVSNDKRIRKAICRAFIRFRFGCTKAKPETIAANSNLTGALSQLDWATFRGKRSFDQLAILVQNRRKFLVQMTINLGAVHEMEKSSSKAEEEEEEAEGGGEYMEEEEMQRAGTSLTEIHDCTVWEEENEEEEEDEKVKGEELNEKIHKVV